MEAYDNGLSMEVRANNWEFLYKFFLKKRIPIGKEDFDSVMHCAEGAAEALIRKCYAILTKRNAPKLQAGGGYNDPEQPAYTRATASTKLRNNEIARVPDDLDRTIRAVMTLERHEVELARNRRADVSRIFQTSRTNNVADLFPATQAPTSQDVLPSEVREVKVKTLQADVAGLDTGHEVKRAIQPRQMRKCAVAALDVNAPSTPGPGYAGKTATEIMKTVVTPILQENDTVMKSMDPRKDIVTSFLELAAARSAGVTDALSARVFDAMGAKATQLAEGMLKMPKEFYKVWNAVFPLLGTYSETSPGFHSIVQLLCKLGRHMKESDGPTTHQIFGDVAMGSLSSLLVSSPGKRETLSEVLYSFCQDTTSQHLSVLRGLKEHVEDLPDYICCLASLISLEARMSLLDENPGPGSMLDLYVYYSLIALQNPQPKVRVAGLSILNVICQAAGMSVPPNRVDAMLSTIPAMVDLASDTWWEVQAQLIQLSCRVLRAVPDAVVDDNSQMHRPVARLVPVIQKLLSPSASQNVLQIGLCSLVHVLKEIPALLTDLGRVFLAALLAQPVRMRRRLLTPVTEEERHVAYVMGTASRIYEEVCLPDHWPAGPLFLSLGDHVHMAGLTRLAAQHFEVLEILFRDGIEIVDTNAFVEAYERMRGPIIFGLIDADVHHRAAALVLQIWTHPNTVFAEECLNVSKSVFGQILRTIYGDNQELNLVREADFLEFLSLACDQSPAVAAALRERIARFRTENGLEYSRSSLGNIF
mmetsp:Transcript_54077/g.123935  ORF Transcript_54077/g.123935 Transcript_54077/m.123935 type:complete len:759 (-) Transcript_54077:124-2400(-)